MRVAGMVGWVWIRSREEAGKWIHKCPRTQAALAVVQTRRVRVRAARAKMGAAHSVTAKITDVVHQCGEGMLKPGLANLLEAVVVIRAAAHPIHILRDNWMIVARQLKPIQVYDALITRCRSNSEADKGSVASTLRHRRQISDDDIWAGDSTIGGLSSLGSSVCSPQRWQRHRLDLSVDHLLDLNRIHSRHYGNFPCDRPSLRGATKALRELA